MTEHITKSEGNRWKQGESGNPKGRPKKDRALTEILRLQGQEPIEVNGEIMTAQQIVAKAVWHLAVRGEVWLAGRRLTAESVTEWIAVIKWLYTHIDPPKFNNDIAETEMVVRVVREDSPPLLNDNQNADLLKYEPENDSSAVIPSSVQAEDK